jgi:hypothetical protein
MKHQDILDINFKIVWKCISNGEKNFLLIFLEITIFMRNMWILYPKMEKSMPIERLGDVVNALVNVFPAFASFVAALAALIGAIISGAIKIKKAKSSEDLKYYVASGTVNDGLSAKK